MTIREEYEQLEREILSPYATLAAESRGRQRPEERDPIRTDFQRDRDRIIHSKSFRRLKHKTQVFIDPEEDHYRTRLTHTLEVSQIARTIARALRLNEDLTEAIALAHDLGHTPFGHLGEQSLDEALREYIPGAHFHHSEQSLRVVDQLENKGRGLNLTWEVRNGILHHSKGREDIGLDLRGPSTLEGKVVRISDRIAYINHDIDDAIRAGIISASDLPEESTRIFGHRYSERIASMVMDVIKSSLGKNSISVSESHRRAMNRLKDFLFQRVYVVDHPGMVELKQAGEKLKVLFRHYMEHPDELPLMAPGSPLMGPDSPLMGPDLKSGPNEEESRARAVCDFIASMTDRYAQKTYAAVVQRR
ncbi:MAG: deoxyguanosinetriphosphate triphosphohydrolase [Armatimonadetes bacterium]|nr:deoxyguanosinetriphosphate triphosphohydrolase [Armatimonadota bacterium]